MLPRGLSFQQVKFK